MHNYDPIYIKIYPSSHKQKTPLDNFPGVINTHHAYMWEVGWGVSPKKVSPFRLYMTYNDKG